VKDLPWKFVKNASFLVFCPVFDPNLSLSGERLGKISERFGERFTMEILF
jgi:hypothetical protein